MDEKFPFEEENIPTEDNTPIADDQQTTEIEQYESTGAADFEDFSKDGFSTYEKTEDAEEQSRIRYEEIFDRSRPKTMGWSIASLVVGIFSLICCCFGWTGLLLGVLAIVFAVISRKTLGYFDGMTIAGLILGIFGTVFGGAMLVVMYGPVSEMMDEIMQEYYKELENQGIQGIPSESAFASIIR